MRKDEAAYQAARQYQADHPGVSYTRAKRIVAAGANPTRAPLAASFRSPQGPAVSINLEWPSAPGGGPDSGPHALLVGADASALLPVLADTLAAGQDKLDLEILYSTPLSPPTPEYRIAAEHTHVSHQHLADQVTERIEARQRLLMELNVPHVEEARAQGNRLPTVVVLIERPGSELVEPIINWSRRGRSLGIDVVVAGDSAPITEDTPAPAGGDPYRGNLSRAVPQMTRLLESGMFWLVVSVISPGTAAIVMDGETNPLASSLDRNKEFLFAAPEPKTMMRQLVDRIVDSHRDIPPEHLPRKIWEE